MKFINHFRRINLKIGNFKTKTKMSIDQIPMFIIYVFILILEIFLYIFTSLIITIILFFILTFMNISYDPWYLFILTSIIISFISYLISLKSIRLSNLNEDEITYIKKNDVLVHYTNYIDINNDTVAIKGNNSRAANYSIKFSQSNTPYIWFHKCSKDSEEPNVDSLNSNHMLEGKRKYKVIIDPNLIDFSRVKIRRHDQSLIYSGNLTLKCKIERDFTWVDSTLTIKNVKALFKQAPIIDIFAIIFYAIDRAIRTICDVAKI